MALNLAPILLGLGAFWLLAKKDDSGLSRDVPPAGSPCYELEGIYQFRDSSKPADALTGTQDPNLKFLPLTQAAFDSIRPYIVNHFSNNIDAVLKFADQVIAPSPMAAFNEGITAVRDQVILQTEKHVTAHVAGGCPWGKRSAWSSKMELVHGAIRKLYDRYFCRNLPGLWSSQLVNGLPLTEDFQEIAREEVNRLVAQQPNNLKNNIVEIALNNLFKGMQCGWGGAYQIPFSERQNDLVEAMGALFDQAKAGA